MKTAKLNQEIVEEAHKLIARVYLMEKGDGWLTCLLCGKQGNHSEDLVHKKNCWFSKFYENEYTLPHDSKLLGCVTGKDHFVLLVAHESVQQPTGPSTLGELKP